MPHRGSRSSSQPKPLALAQALGHLEVHTASCTMPLWKLLLRSVRLLPFICCLLSTAFHAVRVECCQYCTELFLSGACPPAGDKVCANDDDCKAMIANCANGVTGYCRQDNQIRYCKFEIPQQTPAPSPLEPCSSCGLVPCGYCQEGCKKISLFLYNRGGQGRKYKSEWMR